MFSLFYRLVVVAPLFPFSSFLSLFLSLTNETLNPHVNLVLRAQVFHPLHFSIPLERTFRSPSMQMSVSRIFLSPVPRADPVLERKHSTQNAFLCGFVRFLCLFLKGCDPVACGKGYRGLWLNNSWMMNREEG